MKLGLSFDKHKSEPTLNVTNFCVPAAFQSEKEHLFLALKHTYIELHKESLEGCFKKLSVFPKNQIIKLKK